MAPSERELSAKLTEGEIFAKTPTARFAIAQHGTAVNPSRAGGRFEPVAMVTQLSDGTLAMFAPEGDGCLQRAKREDAGRFSKEGKSLDDFWYFSSLKSTIREKVSSYFFESDRRTPQFQTQKRGFERSPVFL